MRHRADTTTSSTTDNRVTNAALVVRRRDDVAYIEWPEYESLGQVIALIGRVEREFDVVFDMEDPDLWEFPEGGYRLHGMFVSDLI